jgi:alpha-glucosidase (family GH31 glycosyl hydrolase)
MRALVLQYQDDANVYNIGDQYLFGNDLMVCPVTVKSAQTRTIYLPAGVWYDYWTGQQYRGKQYIHVLTPANHLPVFAKAGAIIPMQPAMKYTGEKPIDKVTLEIFPSAASAFKLYEDDGLSLKYQQGETAVTNIKSYEAADGMHLDIALPEGKFIPEAHSYLAKIHVDKPVMSVSENKELLKKAGDKYTLNTKTGWYYDEQAKVLWIQSVHSNRAAIQILIK